LQWEQFSINAGTANLSQEIERVLKENELLITEWAPYHLANMLKNWFWKEDAKEVSALEVWQKTCCYLYLPRLRDDTVFVRALSMGLEGRDFFAIAQGKDGDRYLGFVFGKPSSVFLDASHLLIEPASANAYADALQAKEDAERALRKQVVDVILDTPESDGIGVGDAESQEARGGLRGSAPEDKKALATQFYASADLNPVKAKMDFALLVDEVVQQFTAKLGVDVKISIEIRASSEAGFDDGLQRAIKENCNVLKFKSAEFE
jgi:hypothetical protein